MKRRYKRGIGKGAGVSLGRLAVEESVCPASAGSTKNGIAREVEEIEDNSLNRLESIDMINNEECNHAEAIAKDLYYAFLEGQKEGTNWEGLPADYKSGWLNVAQKALPIIGKHALGDVKDYLNGKAAKTSGWKKALYWAGGIIIAGIVMTMSGCGHSVDMTPEQTTICKDGACFVIEPGHLSYSQAQPLTDMQPVVQASTK